MKKLETKNSLKNRLLVIIFFIALYPILILVIVGFINYENIVKDRFFKTADNTMQLITDYINSDVTEMERFMIDLLSDQGFYDLMRLHENTVTELDRYNFERRIESYLRSVIVSKVEFDVGGLYFPDTQQLFYNSEKSGLVSVNDIPVQPLVDGLDGPASKTSYLNRTASTDSIYLARDVLDKDTFKQLGILLFRVSPDYLGSIVGKDNNNAETSTFLLSNEGDVLASAGHAGFIDLLKTLQLHTYESGRYELQYQKKEYFALIDRTTAFDFVVVDLIPKDILLQELQKVTDLIILLSLVNLPIYLLVGNLLYKNIMTPIHDLSTGLRKFENGHLDTLIVNNRKDEFGYMIESFNNMTTTMQKLIQEVYVEELARKDAEISALQEQINPHFLYNTLESINWRAQLAGENEIALMIQALSKLMDASINRDQRKVCTIADEIYYMDQYMYLVQMRYGDKITYTKEIDPAALKFMIPKLIIQPLLENAIKHGIEPVGKGTVGITITQTDTVNIKVYDTGSGMTSDKIELVRTLFNTELRSHANEGKRNSIGLQNVARRLFLLYGEQVDIQVHSVREEGTEISIRIPLIREGEIYV